MHLLPRPPETFLGRERELGRLLEYLPGRHLFLLKGIAGIGKTSLVLALLWRLGAPSGRYLRCLEGWRLEDLAHALPPLVGGQTLEPGGAGAREQVLVQIRALNLQDLTLALDDVHHLPPDDLAALVRLLQTYLTARVVLTSRQELPLEPIERVDVFEEKLESLSERDSVELLRSLLRLHPGAELTQSRAEQVAAATLGHPLLLKLVASLVISRRLEEGRLDDPPAAVQEYLLTQVLGRLEPEERELLTSLALSPEPLPRPALPHPDRLEELERRFLVSVEADGRVALHGLLARHLTRSLAPDQRRERSAALAQHFQSQGRLAEAANLWLNASEPERAARLLEEAAPRMCSQGQYQALIDAVDRLPHPTSGQLQLMKANAMSLQGHWEPSARILEGLLEGPGELGTAARVALASVHLNTGRWSQAIEMYEAALEQMPPDADAGLRLKCLNYVALLRGFRGELREAREVSGRSLALAATRDAWARAHALRVAAVLGSFLGDFEEGLRLGSESAALARELGNPRLAGLARFAVGLAAMGLGRPEVALSCFEETLREARLLAETHLLAWTLMGLGVLHRHTLGPEAARAAFEEAARRLESHGNRLGVWMARACAATLRSEDPDAARLTLEEAVRVADELGNPWFACEARLCLAERLEQESRTEVAPVAMRPAGAQATRPAPHKGARPAPDEAVRPRPAPEATRPAADQAVRPRPAGDEAARLREQARADRKTLQVDPEQEDAPRVWLLRTWLPGMAPPAEPARTPHRPHPLPLRGTRLGFLGEFLLESRQRTWREADWPTRKAMKLLALLAHRRGALYPDAQLLEAFWPELEEEKGRGNLRNALSLVRKALRPLALPGTDPVERSRKTGTVRLELSHTSDLEDFEAGLMEAAALLSQGQTEAAAERLRGALGLCRGAFLESFDDEWTRGPRAHYQELRLRALHQLARCCLSLGRPQEAEQAARAGLAQDDLREELHLDLVEALTGQQRRADALRHYRDALAHFEGELGLIPRTFQTVFPMLVEDPGVR